jgi:glycopeptide antibiotics resistance protein
MNPVLLLKLRMGSECPQNDMLKDYILLYFKSIFSIIPIPLLIPLIASILIGAILAFKVYGQEKGFRVFSLVTLILIVVMIMSATVFLRVSDVSVGYNFLPLWSYRMPSKDLQYSMFVENLMNILMFIPLGIALEYSFKEMTWKRVFFVAFGLSFIIEILQFLLKKGFAEFDDVLHNVLGCLIGFGICKGVACLRDKIQRK